ncbi:MAG: chorismate synthase [Bacteroidetes bacterium]|nr:chorismate synthase [Bacteroidota bacterium]
MPANTFGHTFRLTTFGESHGPAVGGVIDNCPAGMEINMDFIQRELDRRRPGLSKIVSQRKERDRVEFLSGIFEGKTTGAPIGFLVGNENQRPQDYEHLKNIFRPSHADYTWYKKYGIRDFMGGGRPSARETVSRVVGGSVAKLLLMKEKVTVHAYTSQVGEIILKKNYKELDLEKIYDNPVRCPDKTISGKMEKRIMDVRKEGDTIGGIITGVIMNVPAGLGEPVFDKLQADLAKAMMSIPAAKGFDYGMGFDGAGKKGSEVNDMFYLKKNGKVETMHASSLHTKSINLRTKTNYSGGIQGGISNGEDIYFRVAFKPVSTIMKKQKTVNIYGEEVEFSGEGRHDPCVLPRAVAVVEAMGALVIADHLLMQRKS